MCAQDAREPLDAGKSTESETVANNMGHNVRHISMDSPKPTSPLAAAAALSLESCAAVLQTALSGKPLKTDRNSRNIDPEAGSAAAAAALAFRHRNDLKSVLDSLRRRAQAVLLKLGFEALVKGSLNFGSGNGPLWAQLQDAVTSCSFKLDRVSDYKGNVRVHLDTLVEQMGIPTADDSASTSGRTVAQWRLIYTALLPDSPFMNSVDQATAEHKLSGVFLYGGQDISVGEFLDSRALVDARASFTLDAQYFINDVLPVPPPLALERKQRRLQGQIASCISALQELEPANGLSYALVVAPAGGTPLILRGDGKGLGDVHEHHLSDFGAAARQHGVPISEVRTQKHLAEVCPPFSWPHMQIPCCFVSSRQTHF